MKITKPSSNKLALISAAVCIVVLLFSQHVSAIPHSLPPSINLGIGGQHELGQVRPPVPEGDGDITQYVNYMIGLSRGCSGHVIIGPHDILVTRSMNNFGTLPATLALRGMGTNVNLGALGTYDYLFAHYGGPGGGFAEVWYVGDLSGSISIPSTGLGHGLSGWAFFTAPNHGSVPDGGATVMLLGAALGALSVVRRVLMGRKI